MNVFHGIAHMSLLPYGSEVRLSMSMTEESCYFKNMHKTHLLDENNILPRVNLSNWVAINIWRLNKILTESEADLPRLIFLQPQINWLFDSEFKLQLFRKSVSNLFIEFYRINQHIV